MQTRRELTFTVLLSVKHKICVEFTFTLAIQLVYVEVVHVLATAALRVCACV